MHCTCIVFKAIDKMTMQTLNKWNLTYYKHIIYYSLEITNL